MNRKRSVVSYRVEGTRPKRRLSEDFDKLYVFYENLNSKVRLLLPARLEEELVEDGWKRVYSSKLKEAECLNTLTESTSDYETTICMKERGRTLLITEKVVFKKFEEPESNEECETGEEDDEEDED